MHTQTLKRLRIIIYIILISKFSFSQTNQYTNFVNPFIGTDAHGHTFPGATYPFGMMQLSPDTRLTGWDGCSGYHYSDSAIYGFSHTHLSGTGCSDYGDILIMPVTSYNHNKIDNEIYKSRFKHTNEKASPGFYEAYLDKYNVLAQLTTGKRMGMHKYSFQKEVNPQIILDLVHRDEVIDSKIEIVNTTTIKGYRQSKAWATDQMVYFYIELSSPIDNYKLYSNDSLISLNTIKSKNCKALFNFKNNSNNTIILKIGISSVSSENAKLNLYAECKDWIFEKLKSSTEKAWNDYLNKIQISTKDSTHKVVFYSAMYHTAISPNVYSDVNGQYRGMDKKIHTANGYEHYTVFSLWDTYRALHPLFTIIEQKRTNDFIKSFLSIYQQANKLPIWELSCNETNCMIGYHSISVIADAIMKGHTSFDNDLLFKAILESSNKKEYGIDIYSKEGYIPAEKEHESVSKTLEYAYDDWCIAQIAKKLNKQDIYKEYIKRAQSYKNIFDKNSGFMRAKVHGAWQNPFNPTEVNVHFTEANSWQYSFYVPQDIENHIKYLGGDEKYCEKLDELFTTSPKTTGREQVDITGLIGQYAHGNEPSHHAAFLYNYAGKPWKTQAITRKIMNELYNPNADGLCGNDDCGQMSAWYVLSSIGFYPVCPGDNNYIIGSPLFDNVQINLENGKKLILNAKNNSKDNIFIQSIKINDKAYTKSFITHNDIINGNNFVFEMNNMPNKDFGVNVNDRPRSFIDNELIEPNPYFEMGKITFKDSVYVSISSINKDAKIFYCMKTMFNSDSNFIEYKKPILVKESSIFKAYGTNNKGIKSRIIESKVHKINKNYTIKIINPYNPQYNAGGDEGLIDGIRGETNFRLGGWQGYQDVDFEAIVDLGTIQKVNKLGAGFLQDVSPWIWFPTAVFVETSEDGKNFKSSFEIKNEISDKDYKSQIKDFTKENLNISTRYIKIKAKNYGTIPEWHPGAGYKAFIFVDEIIIE